MIAEKNRDELKKKAVEAAFEWIEERYCTQSNLRIGVGSGSTVSFGFTAISSLDNLGGAVPTSRMTESELISRGVPVAQLEEVERLNFDIDGADEVDPNCNLIKGGWGCHTREKRVAEKSDVFIVVADETKTVDRLGLREPVPLEVQENKTDELLTRLGKYGNPEIRLQEGEPFITDGGNPIIDLSLSETGLEENPASLEMKLNDLEGVIENGLFAQRPADIVFVGKEAGVQVLKGNSSED